MSVADFGGIDLGETPREPWVEPGPDAATPYFPEGAGVGIGSASEQAGFGLGVGSLFPGVLPVPDFYGGALESEAPSIERTPPVWAVPGGEVPGSTVGIHGSQTDELAPFERSVPISDDLSILPDEELAVSVGDDSEYSSDPAPQGTLEAPAMPGRPQEIPPLDCATAACSDVTVRTRDFRVQLVRTGVTWPAASRPRTRA